jgi:hypothetical protein
VNSKERILAALQALPDDWTGTPTPRRFLEARLALDALSPEELTRVARFMLASVCAGAQMAQGEGVSVSMDAVLGFVLTESAAMERNMLRLVPDL